MPLRLFNTYSRALETFEPLDPAGRLVRMYTCGPTVYNHAHIGNFRAYVFEDILQRHLEYRGYKVERVMNLTDVDDKTIRGCSEAGLPLREFTRQFKEAFFADLKTLRIEPAAQYPEATDPRYIAKMIAMIGQLMEGGQAYQAEDGSVYFRLGSFPKYGCLAHLNLEELRPGGRVANDEYEKENIGDFALWKAWTAVDGDVAWESPWGKGRPGWHIECSAMAVALLGPEIDIHCGAVDNIFPHHEAEIAQSESCTGRQFVRYWVHCEHLMVEGRKMAKSTGNFFTLRDLITRGYTGREIRYALLSNYRLPLNFTFEGLAAARSALARIDEWIARVKELAPAGAAGSGWTHPEQAKFDAAMDDNLNIAAAMGCLFDLLRETNRAMDGGEFAPGDARELLNWWERINTVLAIEAEAESIPEEVKRLADERAAARAAKDWAASDRLRGEIEAKGWALKDTKEGQKLTLKAK